MKYRGKIIRTMEKKKSSNTANKNTAVLFDEGRILTIGAWFVISSTSNGCAHSTLSNLFDSDIIDVSVTASSKPTIELANVGCIRKQVIQMKRNISLWRI